MKELFQAIFAGQPLPEAIVRPVPRVPEGLTLDRVLEAMRSTGAQMAIVMDEHGGTAGNVIMENLFEEVVGDIEEPDGLDTGTNLSRRGRGGAR